MADRKITDLDAAEATDLTNANTVLPIVNPDRVSNIDKNRKATWGQINDAVLGTSTGIIAKTGTGAVAARTITGTANQVTVTNGTGVSGNPTLALPQNIHTGATPTFAGATLNGNVGVRAASTSSASTQIPVFTADPASTTRTVVTRTPAQLRGDMSAVEGPASSTTDAVAVFADTSGKLLKDGTGTVTAGKFSPTATTVAGNGMYLPAANTVAFSTAGVERVRISSSGAVNVDSDTATAQLSIRALGGTQADRAGRLVLVSAANFSWVVSGANDSIRFIQDSTERMRITSGNNVVFGNGDTAASPAAATLRGTNASGNNTAGPNMTIQAGRGTGDQAGGSLSLQTAAAGTTGATLNAATTRLFINAAGNVGIGTTSPATTLDVNGDVTITDKIIHSGDTNTAIRFPANDTVAIETNGSERLRISSTGNVGIGTTSPSLNFVVNGTYGVGDSSSVNHFVLRRGFSSFSAGNVDIPITLQATTTIFVSDLYRVTVMSVRPSNAANFRFTETYLTLRRNSAGVNVTVFETATSTGGTPVGITITAESVTTTSFTLRIAFNAGGANATILVESCTQLSAIPS